MTAISVYDKSSVVQVLDNKIKCMIESNKEINTNLWSFFQVLGESRFTALSEEVTAKGIKSKKDKNPAMI